MTEKEFLIGIKHEGSFDSRPYSFSLDGNFQQPKGVRNWTADYGTGIRVDRRNMLDRAALQQVYGQLRDIYNVGQLADNNLTLMVSRQFRTLAFELMKQAVGEPMRIKGAK